MTDETAGDGDEPPGPFPVPPLSFEDAEGHDISVRPLFAADDADVEALVEMYVDFDPSMRAQGIPPTGESRVRDWLETLVDGDDGYNVVAWDGDDAVGHATLVPDGDAGYELAIFVHQDYQGCGIGTRLIRTLLGYGAENGVGDVWLTVERWNHAAVALYEKVGFETTNAESFELEMAMHLAEAQTESTG
ncbi:GNAT family N-acetyltransferase [Halarchaeum grantii]|uniref:GNAT family N-acetyltransferase n=1 Tax=Halarchaeum grantii TaxID=1193105 RepID=A0A830F8C8_9EURY|nr:GNAT family N-acetyltransferase [Halarchaeum grantii]GGL29089.1 GNAT family N-acetyltransferase [Halarchaeum grantii]